MAYISQIGHCRFLSLWLRLLSRVSHIFLEGRLVHRPILSSKAFLACCQTGRIWNYARVVVALHPKGPWSYAHVAFLSMLPMGQSFWGVSRAGFRATYGIFLPLFCTQITECGLEGAYMPCSLCRTLQCHKNPPEEMRLGFFCAHQL